jgi:hypothetical protein
LNLNNFKMIEAMELSLHRGPLEWHYLGAKFHENLPSGSKVIIGGGGHIQTQREREREWRFDKLNLFFWKVG